MWELDCEEGWAPKNWCFWTVVLEKTLESPLDCKEMQPVHSEGDQSWVFIGRTDAEAETPILWPPHVKSWLIGKDPNAGRDWGQEEKGTTEDEMAGWHHWLNGRESEWTLGVGDEQGGLVCCDSWGQSWTRLSNWPELKDYITTMYPAWGQFLLPEKPPANPVILKYNIHMISILLFSLILLDFFTQLSVILAILVVISTTVTSILFTK